MNLCSAQRTISLASGKTRTTLLICVYIDSLKEIVDIYRSQSSPIFICCLDASKAFDKINYWLLFHKLINRNVPLYIVRFLSFWYAQQQVCVQWGSAISESFHVLMELSRVEYCLLCF